MKQMTSGEELANFELLATYIKRRRLLMVGPGRLCRFCWNVRHVMLNPRKSYFLLMLHTQFKSVRARVSTA